MAGGVAAEADLYDQLAPAPILNQLGARPAAANPGHTSMRVQARALYRKSYQYQARNWSTNICIVSAPVLFCILLVLLQLGMKKLMSGEEYTCGCQCTRCCYGGNPHNCTSVDNTTCPYTCLERNTSNCGLQFSVGTQVAFCDMPHPSVWPAVVQTPRKEERAAINWPKVTLLYTPGQNDTMSQKLSAGLFPAPSLQASTLLAAQQYLAQYAQQMPSTSVPGEAFALLGMQRLGSSSVMLEAAGLYLESALAPNSQSLDMLWQDGTCKQLGLHGVINTSLVTALQAMVNASNPAGVAALLNSRISSLESDAGGSAAAAQVAAVRVNCTDVVLTKMSTPEKLQRVLYCGNRLAACNGQKATNSFGGAFDWASTSDTSFSPVVYYNDTYEMPDDGSDIGKKYTRKPQLLNMAINSWLSNILGVGVSAELLGVGALPLKAAPFGLDWTPILGPVLATWILQLLLPVFVGQLVYEKENRLRMMMKMHGLQDGAYWLVQYSWFLLLYIVYAAAFLIFGTITNLAVFTYNDYGIQIGLLFVWGNAMIALSLLLSCFFTSTRTATVFCYMFVFATGLIGYLLMRALLDLQGYVFWIEALQVLPPLALYRGLYELGCYADLGMQRQQLGMSPASLYDGSNGMVHAWAMLAGEWVVMMVLAWYLEQVYASGTGNRRHPLFFLEYLRRSKQQPQDAKGVPGAQARADGSSSSNSNEAAGSAEQPVPVSTLARTGSGFQAVFGKTVPVRIVPVKLRVMHALGAAMGARAFPLKLQPTTPAPAPLGAAPDAEAGDSRGGPQAAAAGDVSFDVGPLVEPPDVAEERLRVAALEQSDFQDNPLIIQGLQKLYPAQDGQPPKLAVRQLDLAVAAGECFGLLGPNGAGKSTSISMLVGLQEPSAGTAIIGGHDIRQGMQPVYGIMGLCPQQDLLWATLSGREHLRFYGRLKGLSGPDLESAVELGLKAVKLWSVADKPSGSYSGGMQRRLSVAISLMGSPKVVYLDEPSTGLDPASRRVLWDVIKAAKPGRAIILTTHNMEEAEVLCDRLGIFVSGRLACIGHPKDITSRFCGYLLFTIAVPADKEGEARQLVTELAPGAQLTYSVGGTLKYELPTEQVSLSRVFSAMAGLRAAELGVIDWAVANATMEEVFIRITQQMNLKATE